MKTYISGQITGLDLLDVKEKFAQAEEQVKAFGHTPVNPINNGLPVDATWEEHMVRDIYLLLGCDTIYLLGDWGDSQGARIEANIAMERGLKVIHQPKYAQYRNAR